jgi:DNA-binding NtrC family response regulator
MGKTIEAISRPALEALRQHEWPGNIRELRNAIERSMILCQGPTLRIELPPPPGASRAEPPAEDLSLEEVERRHIRAALKQTGWRVRVRPERVSGGRQPLSGAEKTGG